jgi:hypothetical protein
VARRLKPWKDLSPAYRRRLQRAGITATSRRSGADQRIARGHRPRPRAGQAPAPLLAPEPSTATREARRVWRQTLAPDWLPNRERMADSVAAALSGLRNPRTWRKVDLTPAPAGQPWSMTVTYVSGYPQTIEIPADQYLDVLHLLALIGRTDAYVPDEAAWRNFIQRGRDYDVHGTP